MCGQIQPKPQGRWVKRENPIPKEDIPNLEDLNWRDQLAKQRQERSGFTQLPEELNWRPQLAKKREENAMFKLFPESSNWRNQLAEMRKNSWSEFQRTHEFVPDSGYASAGVGGGTASLPASTTVGTPGSFLSPTSPLLDASVASKYKAQVVRDEFEDILSDKEEEENGFF